MTDDGPTPSGWVLLLRDPIEGQFFYDLSVDALRVYRDGVWRASSSSVTLSDPEEGEMEAPGSLADLLEDVFRDKRFL